jgi:hypothetical protein
MFADDVSLFFFQGAMRLVVLVRETLTPGYEHTLHGFLDI